MAYTEFTLWLTPSEPLKTALRSTIHQLAARLEAVEFDPHVTVFCGRSSDDEARAVAERIAGQFAPIELTADGLLYTERYTKTLFVQFQQSVILRRMFEMAVAGYALPSDYSLNPHLSLLYKILSEPEQRKLSETLDVSMGSYRFDGIRMIETELPIEDAGPVRRWRTVCEAKLRGPGAAQAH